MIKDMEFIEMVTDKMSTLFDKAYYVEIIEVPKNNNVILTGMRIQKEGCEMMPVIYLDPYFLQYKSGMTLEEIIDDIYKSCMMSIKTTVLPVDNLYDFNNVKERIAFKLVNRKANRKRLEKMPFKPFLDLAIIFYMHLDQNQQGQLTAEIYNEHVERWGTTVDELYQLALENTPRLLPSAFRNMDDLLKDLVGENMGAEDEAKLLLDLLLEDSCRTFYILSNAHNINGAAVILYPEELRKTVEKLDCESLIVIPSSVHEMLIIPFDGNADVAELEMMVQDVNRKEVLPEDVLSGSVYCYTKQGDRIEQVPSVCSGQEES